jgi:hypothetical protein
MNGGKSPVAGLMEKLKNLIPRLKDTAILMGWIGGIILIAFLCWFFTQPVRNRSLRRAANRVLEQSGDPRRLGEALDSPGIGVRFSVTEIFRLFPESAEKLPASACVFTFIGEGAFFPCAALLGPEGEVQEFLPLTSRGEKMLKQVSPALLKLYVRRIEGTKSGPAVLTLIFFGVPIRLFRPFPARLLSYWLPAVSPLPCSVPAP